MDTSSPFATISSSLEERWQLMRDVIAEWFPPLLSDDGYPNPVGPVDPHTLKTRFSGVYAVGDVTSVGTPKAGVFSEEAARAVAASMIADLREGEEPAAYDGGGSCFYPVRYGQRGSRECGLHFRAVAHRDIRRGCDMIDTGYGAGYHDRYRVHYELCFQRILALVSFGLEVFNIILDLKFIKG